MCVAIFKPEGKVISKETLKACWEINSDGGGFAYPSNNKLRIVKELSSFEAYYKKLSKIDMSKYPMILHFRIRTSGNVDVKNIHPFIVHENLCFAHNGVIGNIDVPKDSKVSDTIIFNQKILQKIPKSFINNTAQLTLISEFVGYSKLVFLDNKGNHVIVNEEKGSWEDGIWYSNLNHVSRAVTIPARGYEVVDRRSRYTSFPNHARIEEKPISMQILVNPDCNIQQQLVLNKKTIGMIMSNSDQCTSCGINMVLFSEKEEGLCAQCQNMVLNDIFV